MRVAARRSEDPLEQCGVGGHGDLRAEQPLDAPVADIAHEAVDSLQSGAVVVRQLAGRRGQVPPVDHQFVEGDDAGDAAGKFDTSGGCAAGPRLWIVPSLGERAEPIGDP